MVSLVWTRYGYRAVEPKTRAKAVVIRPAPKPAHRAILDNALLVLAWLIRCIALGLLDTAKLFYAERDIAIFGVLCAIAVTAFRLALLAVQTAPALP